MEPEKLVEDVARKLALPYDEAYKMIKGALDASAPQDALIDLFGYENIDIIFALAQSKDFFAEQEVKNEESKYVEHIIPPGKTVAVSESSLISTAETGTDACYFPYRRFNAVQSQVFPSAYQSNDNLMVCAPTGAGKTDIALLTILRSLRDPKGKVVYVVPMKALATEIARKYAAVFAKTNVNVIEYTGDTELEPRIASQANIIVCTPEKFDVSTRRHSTAFGNIRLVIIDEIHLLGDSRGPVLEILVARMFRMSELGQRIIRIVGLSATLPNFRDVARFIRASAVYYFDSMYRPVPLGVTVTGFKKGSRESDEESYLVSKISQFRARGQQTLVFVHSRARTVKVAKMLGSSFAEYVTTGALAQRAAMEDGSGHPEEEPADRNRTGGSRMKTGFAGTLDLLVQQRIGIHHAGLSRASRHDMEEHFRSGRIDILVCTSTLAWGVNLPAHAVVIYGTSFYSPDKGAFDDLGILDVVQIFGRAGRPQYDTTGEAILVTKASKLDGYLAMLRGSKDIESSLLYYATDAICAEIYLANIFSVSTALLWMKSTFLYVRMLRNPAMYGLTTPNDVTTRLASMAMRNKERYNCAIHGIDEHALIDYILLALRRLESCGLVRVNRRSEDDHSTWLFEATPFGRIASLHYLSHLTMHLWLENLGACAHEETSLILLLLRSEEFKNIALRENELPYLQDMHNQLLQSRDIDIEFEATLECKLVVLLSAYFTYFRPKIFSLICDTDFIIENLGRMLSALKEILLHLKRYEIFRTVLYLERRIRRERLCEGLPCTYQAWRCGKFIDLSVRITMKSQVVHALNGPSVPFPLPGGNTMGGNRSLAHCQTHAPKPQAKTASPSSLLLYKGPRIVYAAEFRGYFRNYVPCPDGADSLEVHCAGLRMWTALECAADLSMAGFYYHGVHCCGPVLALTGLQGGCPHFTSARDADKKDEREAGGLDRRSTGITYGNAIGSFHNLNIQFITVDVPSIRERLKVVDSKIYKLPGSLLVVCSSSPEEVANEVNTRLALDSNFNDMFEYRSSKTQHVSRRWIARLSEARQICYRFECVVFRGCSTGQAYYPAYEILELCNHRSAIIYECEEFITYFRSITGAPAGYALQALQKTGNGDTWHPPI